MEMEIEHFKIYEKLKVNATYHHHHGTLEKNKHPQLDACDPNHETHAIKVQKVEEEIQNTHTYKDIERDENEMSSNKYDHKVRSLLPLSLAMKRKKVIQ